VVGVVNNQRLPGEGDVARQGLVINGQGVTGIEIFVAGGGAEQGVVVNVTEVEDLVLDEVNGAGVGMGKLAGLEEHRVQQGMDVFDVIELFHNF